MTDRAASEARKPPSRSGSLARVTLAYVVGAVIAIAVAWRFDADEPLMTMAIAHAVLATVVFGFSVVWNNSSVFDPYWSVAPPLTVAWLAAITFDPEAEGAIRQAIVAALVFTWGVRLTFNWARGWTGLDHEDWRYVDFRRKTGRAYWLVSYLGIHMFPALLVWTGCIALVEVARGDAAPSWIDALGLGVTLMAIAFETIADRQLHDFRRSEPPREAILDTGLWRYSRHPNYFGELSLWWGFWLFAVAASGQWLGWAFAGPVVMTVLFVFVSVPLIERRALAKRPHYAERIRTTSMLLPLPPRERRSAG